ncbi:uncharacterized protein F5Z01DRAFT_630554, partial [Emericellopsis atlantica]
NTRGHGKKSLALIGDALLRLILVDDSVSVGPGECQRICSVEASNKAVLQLQSGQKLVHLIETSPCQKGWVSPVTGASTMEALLGALWIIRTAILRRFVILYTT